MIPQRAQRVVAAWIASGALILGWGVGASAFDASGRSEIKAAAAQAAKTEHFYLVVAGERSGSEPGPMNKLARDLRELSPEEVANFRGDSNRYGGISSELGFDPFEGPNCSECGPLDFVVQETVLVVKGGGIDSVVAEIKATVVEEEPIPRPPGPLWALWLVSLPGYLGATYVLGKRREEDRFREFGTERVLLRQVQEIRRALPASDPRAGGLEQLARRLEAQMNRRVTFAGQKKQDMRLEALTAELEAAVESIEAGNRELT